MVKHSYFKNFFIALFFLAILGCSFFFSIQKYKEYSDSFSLTNEEYYQDFIAKLELESEELSLNKLRKKILKMPDSQRKADLLIQISKKYLAIPSYDEFYNSLFVIFKIINLPEYYYLDTAINIAKISLTDENFNENSLVRELLLKAENNDKYSSLAKYIAALTLVKEKKYNLAINKINEINNYDSFPYYFEKDALEVKKKCELMLVN
jgi:hypothetical protein